MNSLKDQLLKAGLVNDKQVRKANNERRNKHKAQHQSKQKDTDEAALAIKHANAEKAQRDRELNAQAQAKKTRKAIAAQVCQLIEVNKLDRTKGEIDYNFTHAGKIKKITVTQAMQSQIASGHLSIVLSGEIYEVVPKLAAEKITHRDEQLVVNLNVNDSNEIDEDDPYADYQVPDDLTW